jgi:hypothetical protein
MPTFTITFLLIGQPNQSETNFQSYVVKVVGDLASVPEDLSFDFPEPNDYQALVAFKIDVKSVIDANKAARSLAAEIGRRTPRFKLLGGMEKRFEVFRWEVENAKQVQRPSE